MMKRLSFAVVSGLVAAAWLGCSGKSEDVGPKLVEGTDSGTVEDAGGGTTPDAAKDSGPADTGPSPDASKPGVPIKYGTCEPFTACGGDVVGTWKVSGGCLSSDSFAGIKESCAGFKERDVVIKARGELVVTETTAKRDAEIDFAGTAIVPKSCSPLPSCALIEAALKSGLFPGAPKFDEVTCADMGADCECSVTTTIVEKNDGPYTKPKPATIESGGQNYEYCVQPGPRLQLSPTGSSDGGAPLLKLVIEHTR